MGLTFFPAGFILYSIKGVFNMRNGISLEISPNQIEELVKRLPLEEKIILARKLTLETWQARFKSLISGIDRRLKNRRTVSNSKIVGIVKKVRKHNYAESRH